MRGYLVLEINEIKDIKISHLELNSKWNKERAGAFKLITGYQYDNWSLILSNIYGDWFSFSIHAPNAPIGSINYKMFKTKYKEFPSKRVIDVSLWDYKGTTILGKWEFTAKLTETLPIEIIDSIALKTKKYSEGKVSCSDCLKEIDVGKHAGRYFAGIYCTECWLGETGKHKGRGGWKKVESLETYN
jgi:hypothetical protein